MRYIYLPALERRVTLRTYVVAVQLAQANPGQTFNHGLTCWWPCTGDEIVQQFRRGLHERINDGVSYSARGY